MTLLVLAASACADGGVVIEVTPTDPAVDSVRVFVGRSDRIEDATLVVPTASANGVVRTTVPGVTYFPRDAQNELDTKAIKSGETVKFVFVREDVTDLGAIIAVGYAGAQLKEVATLYDLHLPATHFDQYTLKLAPPVRPPVVWGETFPGPANEAACIGITDPATKDPFSVSYIVTPFDQDCDGLDENDPAECNNDAWFGKRPASLDELTCLVVDPGTQTCLLGGPECNDGQPPAANQCVPTKYCVPKQVCSACGGKLSCAEDITTNPTANVLGFGFDCDLAIENGDVCEDELVLTMGPIDGINCTAAAIGDSTHPFADHIDLAEQSIYVKLDDGCQLRLIVKGKAPASSTSTIGLMVAVDLENGHGVAVPIVLSLDRGSNQCHNAPTQCTFDSAVIGPSLLDCATPWSPPMVVPGLVPAGVTNVRSPTLTADGLELFFVSDDAEVWRSSRMSRIDPWHPPEKLVAVSTQVGGGVKTTIARIAPDGQTLYLTSNRAPTLGGLDLFVSRRSGATWSQPLPVTDMVNTQNDETGAATDGMEMFLVFDRKEDMTGVHKLFAATHLQGGINWSAGVRLPGTGLMANDTNPHVTQDARGLYFASDAIDSAGLELFTLERDPTNTTNPVGTPRRLGALSSPQDESDPWVSADQREIYFASNRSGSWRIYRASR